MVVVIIFVLSFPCGAEKMVPSREAQEGSTTAWAPRAGKLFLFCFVMGLLISEVFTVLTD